MSFGAGSNEHNRETIRKKTTTTTGAYLNKLRQFFYVLKRSLIKDNYCFLFVIMINHLF